MAIISAYALPHPPLAVPGVGKGQEAGIARTLASFEQVSEEIAKQAPETIIFITPHNVLYADYFHISPGKSARGDLARFGAATTRFEALYDEELAGMIASLAEKRSIPAGGMGERDPKLDHGVTVPMWFINKRYTDYMTVRISQSGLAPSEHYRLGMIISEAVRASGRKTVLIASSDMSHKLKSDGPYGFAPEGPEFDEAVSEMLASGDFMSLMKVPESLRERAAECGYNSLVTMAGCFDRQRVESRLLSYEGPFGVGYAIAAIIPGAVDESRDVLEQFEELSLSEARNSKSAEDEYRTLARRSLEHKISTGRELPLPDGLPDELYRNRAGVFVSLHKNGRLRGCIGTIAPTTGNIASEIIQNAISAGLKDSRFDPVTASELPYLTYKVDVLSAAEPISGPGELDVKRYGVIVSSGARRGLLLPNLEGVDTVQEQISIARQKAGISSTAPVKLERFEVVRHE